MIRPLELSPRRAGQDCALAVSTQVRVTAKQKTANFARHTCSKIIAATPIALNTYHSGEFGSRGWRLLVEWVKAILMRFLAIDFETANSSPDSACAIGAVLADETRLLHQHSSLIRPPTSQFAFTFVHGLTWEMCREAPRFDAAWDEVTLMAQEADIIVAHNARFDFNVLLACCRRYRMEPPGLPVACTVLLARRAWRMRSNKLSALAEHFGIELNHHEALSDARACALIFQRLLQEGQAPEHGLISRGRISTASSV